MISRQPVSDGQGIDMKDTLQFIFSIACFLILLLTVMGGVFALSYYAIRTYQRAADLLAQWATSNNYRIIESDRRYLRKGPFFLTSSQSQIIYRVTVQDPNGNTRRGWVRCGSFLFGSWQNVVDVQWDDQPANPAFP
jgi:hypothetical protein